MSLLAFPLISPFSAFSSPFRSSSFFQTTLAIRGEPASGFFAQPPSKEVQRFGGGPYWREQKAPDLVSVPKIQGAHNEQDERQRPDFRFGNRVLTNANRCRGGRETRQGLGKVMQGGDSGDNVRERRRCEGAIHLVLDNYLHQLSSFFILKGLVETTKPP
jgi:hypothetical protein